MKQPFGMAFWKNYLYTGNTDAVLITDDGANK